MLTDQRFGDIISQKTMSGPIRLLKSALRREPDSVSNAVSNGCRMHHLMKVLEDHSNDPMHNMQRRFVSNVVSNAREYVNSMTPFADSLAVLVAIP